MAPVSQVPVYAERLDPRVQEICVSDWTCQVSAAVTDLWLIVVAGLAVGFVIGSLVFLNAARKRVAEEQSRTAAERDAFSAFADRVAELDAVEPVPNEVSTDGGVLLGAHPNQSSTAIGAVEDAYRETVMAMPHYDAEYGEPLHADMAAEFGPEVAGTLANATELTPLLQRVLVSKARQASTERAALIRTLSREAESLESAAEEFEDLQKGLNAFHPDDLRVSDYSELHERWAELEEFEQRTAAAVESRQEDLQTHRQQGYGDEDGPSLLTYLYGSLDVDHPVLATAAEFADQIRTSRATLTKVASTRR